MWNQSNNNVKITRTKVTAVQSESFLARTLIGLFIIGTYLFTSSIVNITLIGICVIKNQLKWVAIIYNLCWFLKQLGYIPEQFLLLVSNEYPVIQEHQ